jgi:hypothetical protein
MLNERGRWWIKKVYAYDEKFEEGKVAKLSPKVSDVGV